MRSTARGGVSYANEHVAVLVQHAPEDAEVMLGFFATSRFPGVETLVVAGPDTLLNEAFTIAPDTPVRRTVTQRTGFAGVYIRLDWEGRMLAEVHLTW